MEGQQPPGHSRGRGRATATKNQQQASNRGRGHRPGQIGQQHQQQQQQGPRGPQSAASAWGPRAPTGPQISTPAWGPPPGRTTPAEPKASTSYQSQRPAAPFTEGRATVHRDQPPAAEGGAPATQVVLKEDARGSVRGKRVITEIIRTRPQECISKMGKTGKKVIVQANYFRVLKKPKWSIHQYRVDFSPDILEIRARRFFIWQQKELFGGHIFDGTLLFSTVYLADKMTNGVLEILTKNREEETVQIKIKHVGVVDVNDIQQLQILNLILRRAMAGLNLQLVGRNFFDPLAKICLNSFKLEIWPGYTTSIRQHEQDVLLCAEIAHKVMRTDSIYNILRKCLEGENGNNSTHDMFKKEVVGMIVLTDYNNKTYRVDDVDFDKNPGSKFSTKDGGEISYIEYYQKRYNLTIRDKNQPLLVSRPTEKNIRSGERECIMLVPELSRATGLNDVMRNNFQLMKAMGDETRLNPERRIERLRMFHKRLMDSSQSVEIFKLWDMKLDGNLVELPGRVLPPEKILFGNNNRYTCDDRADWTREFHKNSMFLHTDIKRWYVIVNRRSTREASEFVNLCIQAAKGMRMIISEPRYEEMPDDRTGSYSQAIEKTASTDPQILMLVLTNNNEEKYSCIKKKCCVDRPVPSQVVTLRTIAPRGKKAGGLMSVATKVVIQMNAKLMGAPWMTEFPLKGLMTVGYDVCHSARDALKSYGALVATMDMKSSTRYFSQVSAHMKGQELSNDISLNMSKALKIFRDTHSCLPDRILFFRDGVGDGQLHQVINTEVQILKEKLDQIYKSAGIEKGCRLAFIVVSKRINTRYFVNKQNPVPGTIVDDVITLPERYDFFLVSQSVRQGTVSPTSYNVIYDNMGLEADKLQILTYKMTHMYYNWSGTTRVPAVCQYAHKLAFLVAESIHRAPSNVLENQLYFL